MNGHACWGWVRSFSSFTKNNTKWKFLYINYYHWLVAYTKSISTVPTALLFSYSHKDKATLQQQVIICMNNTPQRRIWLTIRDQMLSVPFSFSFVFLCSLVVHPAKQPQIHSAIFHNPDDERWQGTRRASTSLTSSDGIETETIWLDRVIYYRQGWYIMCTIMNA